MAGLIVPRTFPLTGTLARNLNTLGRWPVTGGDPSALFAAGEKGWWFDPSDFSTLFQDASRTTPVTAVGQPIGCVMDKSGNNFHLTQSGTARPTLRQDVNGFYYIEFDGIDDFLLSGYCTVGSPSYLASVIGLAPNATTNAYMYSYGRIGTDAGTMGTYLSSTSGRYEHYLKGATDTATWDRGSVIGTNKYIISMICDLAQGSNKELALKVMENKMGLYGATLGFNPGVGTFGDYQICMGARAPGNVLSTSRNYGWIGRFATTDTAVIYDTVDWLNTKTGAY